MSSGRFSPLSAGQTAGWTRTGRSAAHNPRSARCDAGRAGVGRALPLDSRASGDEAAGDRNVSTRRDCPFRIRDCSRARARRSQELGRAPVLRRGGCRENRSTRPGVGSVQCGIRESKGPNNLERRIRPLQGVTDFRESCCSVRAGNEAGDSRIPPELLPNIRRDSPPLSRGHR